MSVRQLLKNTLDLLEDQKYEKTLSGKRGSYAEWISQNETAEETDPLGVAKACFTADPKAMILYGDEDVKGEDGVRRMPWFRPDWSPELLESCFYLGSLVAFRRVFLEENLPGWKKVFGTDCQILECSEAVVLIRESVDSEYILQICGLCEKAGGWERECRSIVHFPHILHHCETEENLKKFGQKYPDKLQAEMSFAREEEPLTGEELLSVIIPSKDNPDLLKHCIDALRASAEGLSCEVTVVDNGSSPSARAQIETMEGIRYLYCPMEFDFAKMCNLGAEAATGNFLLFLNDDVELLPKSDLKKMEALANRRGVGCVGIKLYYPDSVKIQHAGVTNLAVGPVHKLQFLEDDKDYYFGMNRGMRNVTAVSAACMMIRTDRFRAAGGFEETLKIAYNDVALGFCMCEAGYRNVCLCDEYAFHHESLSRGEDSFGEKKKRQEREKERLYELFPGFRGRDPYFSSCLEDRRRDSRVRPAYETMNNACFFAEPKEQDLGEGYREDPCLRLTLEEVQGGEIEGYALILGDDNACYDKMLLLQAQDGRIYGTDEGVQYRPDLEENLPDQKNVALGGFWVKIRKEALPGGRYRIGCAVKRRVGNIRLIAWSDRDCEIG